MSVIIASDLSKAFGPDDIFDGISLAIPDGARIALVGANGVGKTTLLRILIGQDFPNTGSVQHAKNLRIGYLPQGGALVGEGTLWEQCLTAFSELLQMQEELNACMAALSAAEDDQDALIRYGALEEDFEKQGGYTYEVTIKQTLSGLGFSETDYYRPLRQLSGGQRTRALLAKILLENPDVLMLDEPTNHLDIQAVEWLEAYFKSWEGALVVVSHDRYFLDQVSNTVWEMTPALEVYHGNYSAYLKQRSERYTRRLAEFEAQSAFIEKEQEYIRRNIAGQNTNQAKGRRRRLERLLEENRLAPPPKEPRRMHIHLNTRGRSGELVLRTYDLQVGYHDEGKPLFACPDLLLLRQECAAIIGPNGAGKTTFLKTILEQIPPYAGRVQLGASLDIGYFAQAHEGLNPNNSLMEEINSLAPDLLPAEIRNYLAKYLFTGDDVFRKVRTLSGGERGRLALAKLSLSNANLLLLDEPTNHLDLPTQEVLESVLSKFSGTILLVSHDRYLIDSLATQIWEVDPQGKSLVVFEGSYTQFKAHKLSLQERQNRVTSQSMQRVDSVRNGQEAIRQDQGLTNFERRKMQERILEIEVEIHRLEEHQAELSAMLENPPENPNEVWQLGEQYVFLQEKIETLLSEWAELERLLD